MLRAVSRSMSADATRSGGGGRRRLPHGAGRVARLRARLQLLRRHAAVQARSGVSGGRDESRGAASIASSLERAAAPHSPEARRRARCAHLHRPPRRAAGARDACGGSTTAAAAAARRPAARAECTGGSAAVTLLGPVGRRMRPAEEDVAFSHREGKPPLPPPQPPPPPKATMPSLSRGSRHRRHRRRRRRPGRRGRGARRHWCGSAARAVRRRPAETLGASFLSMMFASSSQVSSLAS